MRVGEVLNGYEILTAPTNAGGGMSQWSFATREGKNYFVKMFLAPKYPLAEGPGSEATKARKREVCLDFERRHLEIAGRLDASEPGSGNLVIPCDFFRVESTYIKVMERVDVAEVPAANRLTPHQLTVLLRTLVFSLRALHGKGIVHGDLKPDNVLFASASDGIFVSKLIDFDEAYVVGHPPLPQNIVGDPVYYSPEVLWYIKEGDESSGDLLTTASDIFSLGLLIHTFLTGDVPGFDRSEADYPSEVLLTGGTLEVRGAPGAIQPLLREMLQIRPDSRPTIENVIDVLATIDVSQLVPTAPPIRRTRTSASPGGSAIRRSPASASASASAPPPRPAPVHTTAPPPPPPPLLRGSLGSRSRTVVPDSEADEPTIDLGALSERRDDAEQPAPTLRISMGRRTRSV